jgi:hypothetical protein
VNLPHPSKTRTAFAREVHAGRIRWYWHTIPVAYHTVTGFKHTAELKELLNSEPPLATVADGQIGDYVVARLTEAGVDHFKILAEGPGSTSPEPFGAHE